MELAKHVKSNKTEKRSYQIKIIFKHLIQFSNEPVSEIKGSIIKDGEQVGNITLNTIKANINTSPDSKNGSIHQYTFTSENGKTGTIIEKRNRLTGRYQIQLESSTSTEPIDTRKSIPSSKTIRKMVIKDMVFGYVNEVT